MAKESSQKFIARNRAPRVQIEYDVELYGAEKKVHLPFVMGVMADLAGKPEEALPAVPGIAVPASAITVNRLIFCQLIRGNPRRKRQIGNNTIAPPTACQNVRPIGCTPASAAIRAREKVIPQVIPIANTIR